MAGLDARSMTAGLGSPRVRRARGRPPARSVGPTLPALGFAAILFIFPLSGLFVQSVAGGSFEWYAKVADRLYLGVFLRTFEIALLVTIVSLLIGYPVAYFLATSSRRWRLIGFGF